MSQTPNHILSTNPSAKIERLLGFYDSIKIKSMIKINPQVLVGAASIIEKYSPTMASRLASTED